MMGEALLWVARTLGAQIAPPEQASSMTTAEAVAWAAAVLGPLSAVIGYLISSWRSKRDTEKNNETTLKVAEENASVAGRNAATQEFAVITQAYLAEFKRMEDRSKEQDRRSALLEEDVDTLIIHVEAIEELIPNPPGAPERPKLNRRRI